MWVCSTQCYCGHLFHFSLTVSPRAERKLQLVKDDPDSPENPRTEVTLQDSRDAEPKKPESSVPSTPLCVQSSLDRDRELARRREQERRRREAVSAASMSLSPRGDNDCFYLQLH